MKLFVVTCLILAGLLHAAKNAKYDRHVMLKPGVFNVSWYYNANNTRFYFRIQASTNGWAALGFTLGNGNGMKDLDIALGGVKAGKAYLNDYSTGVRGLIKPELDGQQDLNLTSGTESGGKTVLEFNRLADTKDTVADIKLEKGKKVTLCFAIAVDDTTNSTTFNEHSDKDCSSVKYNMYPADPDTTVQPTTAAPDLMMPSLMILILAQVAISMVY